MDQKGGYGVLKRLKDRSLALAPLNHASAQEMLEQTKIFSVLQVARGQHPVNMEALCDLLVKFSLAVLKDPSLQEIDINPLFISSDLCIALDARILII